MAQACPASSMFWLISASNFDLFPLLFFLSLFFLCFTKRVTVTVLHDICIKNRWYKHKYLQARATYFTWIVMWNKQSELHYFSLRIWKSEFLTIMCSSDCMMGFPCLAFLCPKHKNFTKNWTKKRFFRKSCSKVLNEPCVQ